MPSRRPASLFILLFVFALCCPAPRLAAQKTAAVRVPAATLDSYVGQYREQDEPDIVVSVFRDGDRLYMEGARSARLDLTAESNTTFSHDTNSQYTFVTDASGAVTSMKFSAGSQESILTKISSQPRAQPFPALLA